MRSVNEAISPRNNRTSKNMKGSNEHKKNQEAAHSSITRVDAKKADKDVAQRFSRLAR